MAVSSLTEGVDLDLCRVLLLVDLVKVNEDVSSLGLRALALKAEFFRNPEGLLLAETLLEVDGGSDDSRRVLRSNLFDVHTTLGRRDEHRTTKTTIVEDSNVIFVLRVATLSEHNL